MTAAHRTLPLGTKVMVENPETGKQVEVKINDRGPYAQTQRRIIDLSRAAADSIGIVQDGTKRVRVVVTEKAPKPAPAEETFSEVQVGAFEESDEANKVLEVMRERFPEAYIAPAMGRRGSIIGCGLVPLLQRTRPDRWHRSCSARGTTFSSMRSRRMLSHHRPLIPGQKRAAQQSNKPRNTSETCSASPLPAENERGKLAHLLAETVSGTLLEAVLQCRCKAWDSLEPARRESGNAAEEWREQAHCLYGSGSSRGLRRWAYRTYW